MTGRTDAAHLAPIPVPTRSEGSPATDAGRYAGHDPDRPVAAVLAASLHLPGVDLPDGVADDDPACPAERAADLLGRKGLLAKEPATRLALCAVHRALGLPPKAPRRTGPADPGTAVVVSSNLGNVATVGDIARRLREGGPREVGPLEAPNASSNVIAGAVAIWFRFGGPNLTVCSGATAGLDAIWLAGLLLRTGRADRVVVVGTEPDDPQAQALHAAREGAVAGRPLRAGAACLLLGPVDAPQRPLALLGPVRAGGAPADGAPLVDSTLLAGDHYGAAGVVHTALAVRLGGGAATSVTVRCGDPVDGVRELTVLVGPR
ncbi:Beta-ketoacyl synthase, N-terminal domain [Micromonospora coriariae]|uniref:Beta-ketoacyl synthase, N-terminal domain n=1 Tax=Micromonospora coriariae TaxID=285665 RepID=A0A1C4XUB5_9ACTN|nr:beta-ketoacyl synthase N-terminal-like domain-containing protein [Micromonospora coriariae]SCF12077.1 Beta-ketoacyl synthase, N-terminal domain [Micromonospora coriariae]